MNLWPLPVYHDNSLSNSISLNVLFMPQIAHSPSQNDYLPRRHHNGDFTELPRDVEIDGDLDGGVDEPDGQSNAADTTTVNVDSPLMGGQNEEPLECPRCLASFAISRHADLLNHINKCME